MLDTADGIWEKDRHKNYYINCLIGYLLGKQEALLSSAKNMKRINIETTLISQCTGLKEKEINEIDSEISKLILFQQNLYME